MNLPGDFTNDPVRDATMGMTNAEKNMEIPMVLYPEDMTGEHCDELSNMTYISYFRDYEERRGQRDQDDKVKKEAFLSINQVYHISHSLSLRFVAHPLRNNVVLTVPDLKVAKFSFQETLSSKPATPEENSFLWEDFLSLPHVLILPEETFLSMSLTTPMVPLGMCAIFFVIIF